jgi:Glyoxalase-like domain
MTRTDRPVLDHLVYATGDLSATSADLAALTGIEPSGGGRHDGFGTQNRLASLAGGSYLEIIGADPAQPHPATPLPYSLDSLHGPRLMGWAVATSDLEGALARARGAGHDPGEIVAMSRRRPGGETLSWRMTLGEETPDSNVIPFLIDWGATPAEVHPAATSPPGLELVELRARHPEAGRIQVVLDALGVEIRIEEAAHAALEATLATPRGRVVLR